MHYHRIPLRKLPQHLPRTAAGIHEVLGDDLEPVHRRLLLQDMPKVDAPQANAETEMGEIETGQVCHEEIVT